MRAQQLLIAIALLPGCGGSAPPPPAPPPPAAPVEEPPDPVVKPPGYVEVHPLKVIERGDAAALLLVDEATNLIVPIYIGGTEGLSIKHRMNGTSPPRPLTHDLLDAAVKKLKGSIVKVHVDALKDNVYHGSVYIRAGRRVHRLDARSSDAIALALGNRAPIYIAQDVLDATGVPRDKLLPADGSDPDF